ncbi:hypothetical protein SLEP1_g37628 [Rubroshorea leprosula]|uniref:Protein PRD1 n=1 Tax=Rubroshorea leprosula TaxID=152421 RepID=A0AAV5KVG9_9ROSI|nr:hypothetical protein SLEP1_g37628 [Rubroshorea leprosula]
MLCGESQEPDLDLDLELEESPDPEQPCSQGHRASLSLYTQEGGSICLLCLSNLISDPRSPTVHVSYALSQLSHALSQPQFLRSLLSFHPHFLVSSLVRALSSFEDDPIAYQLVHIISALCTSAGGSVTADFVARVADTLSSGVLAWSRRQLHMLHCFGVLLNCQTTDPSAYIKDKGALVSNLVAGLQLPRVSDEADVLHSFCPDLLRLSLEALMKTQRDDVRLNCVALLTILAQKGFLGNAHGNGISSMNSDEADSFMQTTADGLDETPPESLFAEAIKGPLLSSDSQVQISTLDLIFQYLSGENALGKQIQVLVEENIVDYILEILRLSECKDTLVISCLKVLNLFSSAGKSFIKRLVVGFTTLLQVLRYVAEVPFHPVQSHTLKLIWNSISDCPGIVSASHTEELVVFVTKMLKRHIDGKMGMLSETFIMACSIFVALLKSPSSQWTSNIPTLIQEASRHAILASLSIFEKDPGQLLYSLYLLKEAYEFSYLDFSTSEDSHMELRTCIVDVCTSHLLPWFARSINEINEEIVLGVLETLHSILLGSSDIPTTKLAKVLISSSWFSLSFGCLGLFPTEKLKWRVYLMLSSLVDVLMGNESGQPIRDAASFLPSDPTDLLFLLGQKSSDSLDLSSCQSAVLLILHLSCLYDDRLADEKSLLASVEQYIIVNSGELLSGGIDSKKIMELVNIYGLSRGLAKINYQIPYSPEAERILFHVLTENEWDLSSAMIHSVSLKWLFQQDKISEPLSSQLLEICRKNCTSDNQITIYGGHSSYINAEVIAELVASGDNYGAKLLVCLMVKLIEGCEEHDIVAVVNLMSAAIEIFPAVSDQLCLHGISNAIQTVLHNSIHSSSRELYVDILLLIFNILSSVQSKAITDNESWVAVPMKLMDSLIPAESKLGQNHEGLLVLGILSLILYYSTNEALTEASKSVVFNTPLITTINRTVQEACSKGPGLIEYDEGTSLGENLILLLMLCYFSLRCLNAVLPEAVNWQTLCGPSDAMEPFSIINIQCHDLCRLMHFGSPSVKLVASYCLLETLTRISDQRTGKHEELKCTMSYLLSIMAVLEGLIFYRDIRVAMNCGLCLSVILGWEEIQEAKVSFKNNWFRVIVEEMAMCLAVPCLASKSFFNHLKPAVHVTVALLKLQKIPGWMRAVFDDPCISGIIENLQVTNIKPHSPGNTENYSKKEENGTDK